MALINITPVMTSNTTPSPYVVSASSIFSTTFDAWKAFNGTNSDANGSEDSWITAININTGWIMLDFGNPIKIDALSIAGRNEHTVTASPKDFTLYGSNNGIEFTLIDTFNNQILWTQTEWRLYKLKQQVCFRYYKIIITSNNGLSSYLAIGDIKFLQDDSIQETVTNIKASLTYCLPSNTTLAITQRQNDAREGLLGFANDSGNYGTLHMIDNTGKSIIPMASMTKPRIIFEGRASVLDQIYSMSEPVTNFKYLLITGSPYAGSPGFTSAFANSILVTVSRMELGNASYFLSGNYAGTNTFDICVQFITATTFKVITRVYVNSNWAESGISEIVGIY